MKNSAIAHFILMAAGLLAMGTTGCSPISQDHPEDISSKALKVLDLSPEFISVSGITEGQEYEKGSTAIITITPGENLPDGFSEAHPEHIHVDVNGTVYMPEQSISAGETAESLKIEIEIPSEDFEVVACYSVQQQLSDNGYTMTLEDSADGVKLYGVSPDVKYKYFDCYLLVPDAYVLTGVQFKVGDGQWQDINSVTGCSFAQSGTMDNLYTVTVRPDYQDVTSDVTLRVEGEQHARHTITWENADETLLNMEYSNIPTSAIDGEKVTAELWVNGARYLNSATSSVDGLEIEVQGRIFVSFIMPDEDVTVTLDIRDKIPVSYSASENISEATFYDLPDIYYGIETAVGIPGESVYIFASADAGYKPMTAELASGESFGFQYYSPEMYVSEILIPEDAESVEVSIGTSVAYTATGDASIFFDNGSLYAEGEKVTFKIQVPDGQRISSVSIADSEGNAVPLDLDNTYGSFTMPASDVTVSAEFESLGGEGTVSVKAYFDPDVYDVSSSTNWDWDFAEGFTVDKGTTFYFSVYNWNYDMYYVGVKIGDSAEVYPATFDDMMGEYSFGKSIVADGDVTIKVGASEEEVSF